MCAEFMRILYCTNGASVLVSDDPISNTIPIDQLCDWLCHHTYIINMYFTYIYIYNLNVVYITIVINMNYS